MGTELYARGFPFERCFDELNLSEPRVVSTIHRDYLAAGAELIETNTFGANRLRLGSHGLADRVRDITFHGARLARDAREVMGSSVFVGGSVGPLGRPLVPYGALTVGEAEAAFRETAEGLLEGGVDCFLLETFSDLREALAALRAVRGLSDLPVVAHMSFGEDGKTPYGNRPEEVAASLLDAGADLVGVNCSVGPQSTLGVLERMSAARPEARFSALPNAGLPQIVEGRYQYPGTPSYFAGYAPRFLDAGVSLLGGCCGTTPAHTRAMATALRDWEARRRERAAPAARRAAVLEVEISERPRAALAPEGEVEVEVAREPRLLQLLREKFVVSVELDPPRGIHTQKILDGARRIREAGVDAVNIADSPMARVRMGAQALAWIVKSRYDLEVILHFTTRDRNLMGIQADLLGAHAAGVTNILCLTGDPPSGGDYPNVTAVYDVDSIGLIHVVHRLNDGSDLSGNPIGGHTQFAIGCAVNPTAEDLELEAHRFRRKLEGGASFAMTQPFYEWEAWDRFTALFGPIPIPVLMGILPLQSLKHAEFLHNEVPGITVPARFRERLQQAGAGAQAEGVGQARELLQEARRRAGTFAGVYLMPSFGRYENCLEVLR